MHREEKKFPGDIYCMVLLPINGGIIRDQKAPKHTGNTALDVLNFHDFGLEFLELVEDVLWHCFVAVKARHLQKWQ